MPATVPNGRLKRAGRKNFILVKATLTQYTKREEVKCEGREKGVADQGIIFIKHRLSFEQDSLPLITSLRPMEFEREHVFEPKVFRGRTS